MKKLTCLGIIVMIMLTTNQTNAQNFIAVQNGNTPKFYSILQDAFTNAQNKDTIYIPGGVYSFANNDITIDKELHLIGAGHYPDSTAVGITQINSNVFVIAGANNSTFEGLNINGNFYTGNSSSNEDVDNITISRCSCFGLNLSQFSANWLIRENVVKSFISASKAQNNLISNNIFEGGVSNWGPNNIFRNNFFIYNGIQMFNYVDGCVFQNNIFTCASIFYPLTSCIFENNLFFTNFSISSGSIGSNNITSQSATSTCINQSGNTFSYSQDYHLKSTSPGKNAGKDGTDIGIYGGAFPWKEGSIPSNPHFQIVKIGPKTDSNGNLNVKIKVAAQDN